MTSPCQSRVRDRVEANSSARRAISPRRLLQRLEIGLDITNVRHNVGATCENLFIEAVEGSHRALAQTRVGDFRGDLARALRTLSGIAALDKDLDDFQAADRRFFRQAISGERAASIAQIC